MNLPNELIHEIQNVPWFNELSSFQVECLAQICSFREVKPGEELFREGDRPDNLYVVLSGEIVLEYFIPSMGKLCLTRAEPLDIVGWSCMTPIARQRAVTARACQPSRLIAIKGEELLGLCEEDHDLGYLVMRRVANVVASHFLTTRLHLFELIRNSAHSLAQSNLF